MAELAVAPAEMELQLASFVELSLRIMPLVDLEPGVVPQVFLHLIDEPGSVLRTFDHRSPGSVQAGTRDRLSHPHPSIGDRGTPGSRSLHPDGGASRRRGRPVPACAVRARRSPGSSMRSRPFVFPSLRRRCPACASRRAGCRSSPGGTARSSPVVRSPAPGPGRLQIGPLSGPGEILLRLGLPIPGAAADSNASPTSRRRRSVSIPPVESSRRSFRARLGRTAAESSFSFRCR